MFEVEEHMGKVFLDELADVHFRQSLFYRAQTQSDKSKELKKIFGEKPQNIAQLRKNQKSLPSFVYGSQLAELIKKLEKVRCNDAGTLQGAGSLIYDRH